MYYVIVTFNNIFGREITQHLNFSTFEDYRKFTDKLTANNLSCCCSNSNNVCEWLTKTY